MAFVSPSTWNTLGFGVAGGFAFLGTLTLINPDRTGDIFGLKSWSKTGPGNAGTGGVAALVGSRDLTMATVLFALYYSGQQDAMGTVILCSMIICGVDIYLVWIRKRWLETIAFTAGAAIWAVIGMGLKGWLN